jgi:hypothetical protein
MVGHRIEPLRSQTAPPARASGRLRWPGAAPPDAARDAGDRDGTPRDAAARRAVAGWLVLVFTMLLLALVGSWLLQVAPVTVSVAADGRALTLIVDGTAQQVQLPAPVTALRFPSPPPEQREYQIDGSDSTNNFTFDPSYFVHEAASPYYRFQAWLRDEASYSRWRQLVIRDGEGRIVVKADEPANDLAISLPQPFRFTVDLHRIETPRMLELTQRGGGTVRVEIDRNDRYVRLVALDAQGTETELAKRFFPFSWQPSLVEVAYLLLRAAAVAFALAAALTLIAAIVPAWRPRVPPFGGRLAASAAAGMILIAAGYIAIDLFSGAPHILDAVSYTFQARIFASGRLAAPAPPLGAAFPTPFFVNYQGKWFSQYPPGTSALLAVGVRLGLPWLVEPALAALAALLTFSTVRRQFGRPTAACAVLLFATSPFLLLQAGTFLSHVPAMACATIALFAVTRYLEQQKQRWIILGATGLGCAFLCREIVAVLYGLPLFVFIIVRAHRQGAVRLLHDGLLAAVCLACFLLAYLLYNTALTGAPFLLPRHLFNPSDQFGFGSGIGFYGQHTIGAGLVNTDELLTSLTIMLSGWPFYCSLALLLSPFLLRKPQPWEVLHGAIIFLFVLAYVGYFYHGIAFGPRYYFAALPSMVTLMARGLQALAFRASCLLAGWGRCGAESRARTAAVGLLVLLMACDLIYFLPRQNALYQGYSGMPGRGGPTLGSFVRQGPSGRSATLSNALVTTDNWWYYSVYLAALNCPALDCGTVFAFAPDAPTLQALWSRFPGRTWYRIEHQDGMLQAVAG